MKESRGQILIVDDEPDICQLLLWSLVQEGFAVTAATSGPEALATVERELPELIVLDLVLPGMDGLELLRRIREQRGEHARIVVLTAYGTAERARQALALGASEFLAKPFDLPRLLQIVTEQVSIATGRRVRRMGGRTE